MKFIKKFWSTMLLLLLFIILSFSTFIFFKAFSQPPFNAFVGDGSFTTEILAAFLGAFVTMIITAILLRAQTSMEENKENQKEFFSLKLNTYTAFLEFLAEILENDDIDPKELLGLKKWALRLSLISNAETNDCLVTFIKQISITKKLRFEELNKTEKEALLKLQNRLLLGSSITTKELEDYFITVPALIRNIKEDLGHEIKTDKNTVAWIEIMIDELLKKY